MYLLQAALDEAGMTVPELARKSGVTDAHIRHLLAGRRKNPNVFIAQRLANALGKGVSELWPLQEESA